MRSTAAALLSTAACAVPLLLIAVHARAQSAASNVPPQINGLYQQAGKAMAAGRFQDARPKLEQVVEHLPNALGARLELAECYEGLGNLENAWQMCFETERLAIQQSNAARMQEARDCMNRLDPSVPKVMLNVPAAVRSLPNLEITLDGARVDPSRWGAPIAVVRGAHVVAATAQGTLPWRKSVSVQQGGAPLPIDVEAPKAAALPSSGSSAGGASAGTNAGTPGVPSQRSQAVNPSANTAQQGATSQGTARQGASPERAAQQGTVRQSTPRQTKIHGTAGQSAALQVAGAPPNKRVGATDRDRGDGSDPRRRALGTLALGFGGAGAFVGTVLGTIALRVEDKGNSLGTASLLTLATSGALLAAGGVLILTSGPSSSNASVVLNPQGVSAQLRW
ncbi:tetratricopeptide repeat protein [Sorangium sp. So ce542]|uniref:tetratricopeptide repeat protein n=1 Tax=Sorangium sp. So ce542 TaxID=3133316 RepID=UPI003F5DE31C